MNILLIGSGGREHAIAGALLKSARLTELWVAPGNAGTHAHNVALDVEDHSAVIEWCQAQQIDLVIVGPEAPLVAGLVDDLQAVGVRCFGPSRLAAQLEGSKSFTRAFADRFGIPSPQTRTFDDSGEAIAWLDEIDFDVVVKADGLAAGKGVIIPESRQETIDAIRALMDDAVLGDAGRRIVLEERIVGEEISLFGVSDGVGIISLGTAQDHKRVGDGDTGPNTGGMGAFAPVPGIDREAQDQLTAQFLQPAIDGMAANGTPYVGVLFAGLMLTDGGPKLIEYNCRLGDPETQVILPLLDSDLLDIFYHAANGSLGKAPVELSTGAAATVVVCANGYPSDPVRGVSIPALSERDDVTVYLAGARRTEAGELVSSGGRVLAVTGRGDSLSQALGAAYEVVEEITNDELFARTDIGWRHAPRKAAP